MKTVTCKAPVNIATIKYWGKRDEQLILPINDSLSVTLSTKLMCAKTSVTARPEFKKDRIWLNGREESFQNPRLLNCLSEIRERARKNSDGKSEGIYDWHVHICSENNFPTAAGLASSAAGYACLVFALAQLYDLKSDLTELARRGSGSACRSIHGGFVRWHMGVKDNGSDSIARPIASSSHWPEFRIMILVVDNKSKKVSSSRGMKDSVATSELLKHRANHIVPKRIENCVEAILRKDFQQFAEITMKDSNQFHAVCLDSYPPITYMSDTSHYISDLIHAFNESLNEIKVAYTFDAGQNACLFLLEKNAPLVLALINHYFPPKSNVDDYFKGDKIEAVNLPQEVIQSIGANPHAPGTLKSVIYTEVGEGPEVLSKSEHLLNENGFPLNENSN